MTDETPQRRTRPAGALLTPGGSVVPFWLIGRVACVVAVVLGLRFTFGLSAWIAAAVFVLTLGWVITTVEAITIHYWSTEADRRAEADGGRP